MLPKMTTSSALLQFVKPFRIQPDSGFLIECRGLIKELWLKAPSLKWDFKIAPTLSSETGTFVASAAERGEGSALHLRSWWGLAYFSWMSQPVVSTGSFLTYYLPFVFASLIITCLSCVLLPVHLPSLSLRRYEGCPEMEGQSSPPSTSLAVKFLSSLTACTCFLAENLSTLAKLPKPMRYIYIYIYTYYYYYSIYIYTAISILTMMR